MGREEGANNGQIIAKNLGLVYTKIIKMILYRGEGSKPVV